jgi:hypothetical protein
MKAYAAFLAAILTVFCGARTAQTITPAHTARVPLRQYDVAVVGGTPAGIAAAISAARHGMRVAFVTDSSALGGVLTNAMLTQWDVQNAPDGTDVQSQIFHEFYAALPDGFSPSAAAAYFEHRIHAARSVAWYADAREMRVSGNRGAQARHITSLHFFTRGTAHAVSAACYIDATDNADLAVAAGARYNVGEQDRGADMAMQPATLMMMLAGVDWKRVNPQGGDQSAGYAFLAQAYHPLSKRAIVPDANFQLNGDGTVAVNAIDILGVDGRSRASVLEATRIARAESINLVPFLRTHIAGFEHARIARFAPQLYIRETRHVRGLMWINGTHIWNGRRPYDTVVLAAFPMDVHPVRADAVGGDGWAEEPKLYGIPLRALVAYGFENLALAGPSISATHTASGSVRVVPTTIAEGEALGAACAQSVLHGHTIREMALTPHLVQRLRQLLAVGP